MITKSRLLASIGAGGVLYLTPIVFNSLSFSASQIGAGIAFAAIAGTITRLITGVSLDKGLSFTTLLKIAALIAVMADVVLLSASTYNQFLLGELFLGASAGIYWPAIELSIPITCNEYKSSKGFALARSADALGVSIGAGLGAVSAYINHIRIIYITDIVCLFLFFLLVTGKNLSRYKITQKNNLYQNNNKKLKTNLNDLLWLIKKLYPIIIISLFSTGMLSLMQSALPLDLVMGGYKRPPINESLTGFLIAIKLMLLLTIQWPIGNWITKKGISFGLRLSILSFCFGSFIMALSNIYKNGLILTSFGMVLISIGLAAFLPTGTEAVVQLSTFNKRGISMAIYSQCFGISALIAPWIGGQLIDLNNNAMYLWIITGFSFLLIVPLTSLIKIEQ